MSYNLRQRKKDKNQMSYNHRQRKIDINKKLSVVISNECFHSDNEEKRRTCNVCNDKRIFEPCDIPTPKFTELVQIKQQFFDRPMLYIKHKPFGVDALEVYHLNLNFSDLDIQVAKLLKNLHIS